MWLTSGSRRVYDIVCRCGRTVAVAAFGNCILLFVRYIFWHRGKCRDVGRMSGVLYEVQEYIEMLRERERAMENGARYNDLAELNAEIDNRRKKLFGEREAETIYQTAGGNKKWE